MRIEGALGKKGGSNGAILYAYALHNVQTNPDIFSQERWPPWVLVVSYMFALPYEEAGLRGLSAQACSLTCQQGRRASNWREKLNLTSHLQRADTPNPELDEPTFTPLAAMPIWPDIVRVSAARRQNVTQVSPSQEMDVHTAGVGGSRNCPRQEEPKILPQINAERHRPLDLQLRSFPICVHLRSSAAIFLSVLRV